VSNEQIIPKLFAVNQMYIFKWK